MRNYLLFLIFFPIYCCENTTTIKDDHSVNVKVEQPSTEKDNDSVSCSIKSNCLKEKKTIITAGFSLIAFIIMLVIHLTNCKT